MHASETRPMTDGPLPIEFRNAPILTKHHGLGNDFLIVVAEGADTADTAGTAFGAETARRWCDRRLGIGADGLIVATPVGADRWRMVLLNADGGRAEISGNGIRCLGQALVHHLALDPSVDHELEIETDAGTRSVVVLARDSGTAPNEVLVKAGMGKAVEGPGPSERWAELGLVVDHQVGVDIGNPHLVAFVDSVEEIDMATIGPVIEADYPTGCNVHVAAVGPDGMLDLMVWERGVGVTQACGSGACAAAWAAKRAGLLADEVTSLTVKMPGGAAEVGLAADEIVLTGPATHVATVAPAEYGVADGDWR